MILSFSTYYPENKGFAPGTPTHFVESIWKTFNIEELENFFWDRYDIDFNNKKQITEFFYNQNYPLDMDRYTYENEEKAHSLREDTKNRWREGMSIQFYINNRTPSMLNFAPDKVCTGVQQVSITPKKLTIDKDPKVFFKDRLKLSINDGFKSMETFNKYFDPSFQGKIIHWNHINY